MRENIAAYRSTLHVPMQRTATRQELWNDIRTTKIQRNTIAKRRGERPRKLLGGMVEAVKTDASAGDAGAQIYDRQGTVSHRGEPAASREKDRRPGGAAAKGC